MKTTSISNNYFYNLLFDISILIFPLITFPYVTRILGPEGLGKVIFANSVVHYFILLTSLGIPLYGIREIAKIRENQSQLNKIFSELVTIIVLSMLLSLALFILLLFTIKEFRNDFFLFSVVGINIIMTVFSFDWLYKGLENYKFISIRSILVKIISIALLFIFVKTREDYILYAGLGVFALSGNNILNYLHSRKYVSLTFKNLSFKKHIKPIMILFSTTIAIGIYLQLDKMMLGFLSGPKHVGFYAVAIKLVKLLKTGVISLGAVLLPRFSKYESENNNIAYNKLAKLSLDFVFFIGIPVSVFLFIYAEEIILIFAGIEFLPSILTIKILIPVILLIGLSNFFAFQVILPKNKEKYNLIAVTIGASISLLLNFILIPHFYENGAAIATLGAETAVALIMFVYAKKLFEFTIFDNNRIIYFIIAISTIPVLLFIQSQINNLIVSIITALSTFSLIYLGVLYIKKDQITMTMLRFVGIKK